MKCYYLPENWTVEKSQVYCARVADGTHDTPKQVPEGKILVTSKNIKNGKVNFDGCYLISENDYSQINKRSKVDKGDVLFSMIGTVGEIAFVDEEPSYAIKNIGLFKTKSFSDGKWLYYYLTSKIGQAALDTFLTGTSQQFVSLGDLRKVPVIRAPQNIQRKIAAVLSAYDDLIENNNRRIAILEKMAEELYREWFVRLRFPGHEKVKIVKGVPEGWAVVELNKIADEVSKSTKPGTHLENRYYLPIDLLQQRHFNPESHLSYEEAQSSLITFNKGDFLFGAMRPYLHKVCIAPFDGISRTTCFVIRPQKESFYSYIYLLLFQNSTVEYATLICNGADRPYVVWNKAFERMFVFKPEDEIVAKFNNIIRPLITQISNTYFYLNNLKQSRDRLLTRLMSGK
ncbi:MAG TPA: restriction endonuclease subunit S, partial [Smithellaceae bacterium]|nr:restriction endonuclease subunit S [Smithellaceae bacterium]